MATSSAQPHRVLVVEDDQTIGSSIEAALAANGYRPTWVTTGRQATDAVEHEVPALVLLDAGLPDVDGFSVCRWMRERHRDLPIILVTARDAEIDIIVGLDAGASDYVTKPFSMSVLLARVRAHLRVAVGPVDDDAPIELDRLRIEPASYVVTVSGAPADLRPQEFKLLLYFARHAGRVVTRERILADVWDLHWDTVTKTVDMHVVALRRKLGDAIEIVTIRGVGYRLVAP